METLKRVRTDERIILADGGSALLSGSVMVTASEPGFIRVDFETSGAPTVMLRVTEPVELYDGDLIAAGGQWLRLECSGHDGEPARLHLLDPRGEPMVTFNLNGPSLSIGRRCGDVVLSHDGLLSGLHLQVLNRPEGTFLRDLGSSNGTWTMIRPGEILPAGSVIGVDERLYAVLAPPAAVVEPSEDDRTWPIDLHTAA